VPATYLLPIKSESLDGIEELTRYLHELRGVEIVVVDGSPDWIFAEHKRRWAQLALHLRPDPAIPGLNGKARGVLTGLACAGEKVVIADDDVRYDAQSLRQVIDALDRADVVRPQNYFSPHSWHTVLDTGRTLLNRVSGGDWPGTLGVRRSALARGYDPDVLFENLELVRTVLARGGREECAADIYVARRPPRASHFLEQRVRQAYDEFARPQRFLAALAILPLAVCAIRRPAYLALGAACIIAAAETGRASHGGRRYFPALASIAAPLWVLERGISAWLALVMRARYGGVPYGGSVIQRAATPLAKLRERAV
jgi:hypothetical protein